MSYSAVGPSHAGPLAVPQSMWQKRLERADSQSLGLLLMEQEGELEVVLCMDMKKGDKCTEG